MQRPPSSLRRDMEYKKLFRLLNIRRDMSGRISVVRRGALNTVLECASSTGSGQESAKMREWSHAWRFWLREPTLQCFAVKVGGCRVASEKQGKCASWGAPRLVTA